MHVQAALRAVEDEFLQLAVEDDFPDPVEQDGLDRLWNRRQVEAWAKKWRAAKPWR